MHIVDEKLESYAAKHSTSETNLFKALAKATYKKTSLPQMQVGHLEGNFLRLMVRVSKAERILEIGTFTGYSALAMAEGLPRNGKVVTCDIDHQNTQIALEYWKKSPHGKKIELKLGPAAETISKLKGLFDMVFIDADKNNYVNYWELCVPKVRRGGFLLADNVLWSGRVLSPKDESSRWIHDFNEHVSRDTRVETVMLTVRDGITLAYKK